MFKELDIIKLKHWVNNHQCYLAAGTQGTIVHMYEKTDQNNIYIEDSCEVEFIIEDKSYVLCLFLSELELVESYE